MNLISNQLKAEVESAMDSIFDTFAKVSITFYKMPTQEVIVFDPNYNVDFPTNENITLTTQSQTFTCRVNYLDRQEYGSFIPGGEDAGIKAKFFYNRVKLRMKTDAFEYLKNTERFEFLGEKYQIEEGWRRVGILDTFQFYQIILRRVN